ncbi:MAG: hypothetical protein C0595_02475 [Marinilabiliales bacterium]|nr:MAG: hypothetical protein C0595_02475 [Marinilabiliales bacterium]
MKIYKILSIFLVVPLIFINQLFSQNEITGHYYYHNDINQPVEDINVKLYDLNNNLITSVTTNADGEFTFSGIDYGDYIISAEISEESFGVDLYDAMLVFWAAHGWIELTEVEFAASDVDADGEVDMWDFHLIFVEYLIQGNPFPGGDWAFQDIPITLEPTRSVIVYTQNAWATSRGDVEGEWDPSGRDIDLFSTDYYILSKTDKQETTKFAIASSFEGELNGFDLSLVYPIDKINIISISGPDENFNYSVDNESGIIRANWLNQSRETSSVSGDRLFVIEVAANQSEQIENGEIVGLLPGGLLIDNENNKLNNTEIKLPLLENEQLTNVDVSAYPNPVVSNLKFNVSTTSEFSQASLEIYDLSGKKVVGINNIEIHDGEQEILVNTEGLLPGNYVYSFSFIGEGEKNIRGHFVKSK